jgi:hypothetical protein
MISKVTFIASIGIQRRDLYEVFINYRTRGLTNQPQRNSVYYPLSHVVTLHQATLLVASSHTSSDLLLSVLLQTYLIARIL